MCLSVVEEGSLGHGTVRSCHFMFLESEKRERVRGGKDRFIDELKIIEFQSRRGVRPAVGGAAVVSNPLFIHSFLIYCSLIIIMIVLDCIILTIQLDLFIISSLYLSQFAYRSIFLSFFFSARVD